MVPVNLTSALAENCDAEHPAIVVVDDEPELVTLVCETLLDQGVLAASCPHGRRAHACIRAKQPKVALLDIQMPEVDGIELFQQLRADLATRDIPVIFFTANAHLLKRHLPDYAQHGAQLLPKPFDLDALLTAVERALAA